MTPTDYGSLSAAESWLRLNDLTPLFILNFLTWCTRIRKSLSRRRWQNYGAQSNVAVTRQAILGHES